MRVGTPTTPQRPPPSATSKEVADTSRQPRHVVEPKWESNKEDYDQFQQRHARWRGGAPATPPPPPSAGQIIGEIALSVIFGGPIGPMVKPGIKPGLGTSPVRTPSASPPSTPPSSRPTTPLLRPSTPPAQGTSGLAKRPGSPEALPPAKRPSALPATDPQLRPEQAPRPSTSGPSSAQPAELPPAGETSGPLHPGPGPYPELPQGMDKVLRPEQWTSPAERFVNQGGEYRDTYQAAYNTLSPAESHAIRNWSFVEGQQGSYIDYVDGAAVADTRTYEGMNYDLNVYLRGQHGYSAEMERNSDLLHIGLSKLPSPPETVTLLRASDVGPDYGDLFKVGDYVTNGRPFMSASSNNAYAAESVGQGYAAEGRTGGLAIYEIESESAVPLLEGVTTLAGHEAEWLFTANRVFEVKQVAKAWGSTQSSELFPLTAMRLKEVTLTEPIHAKNIHTGLPKTIEPEDQLPPPFPDVSSPGSADWSTPPSSEGESS